MRMIKRLGVICCVAVTAKRTGVGCVTLLGAGRVGYGRNIIVLIRQLRCTDCRAADVTYALVIPVLVASGIFMLYVG